MRRFRRHRCTERHEYYHQFARCLFTDAVVIGDGRYAVILNGRTRVLLFSNVADALTEAKEMGPDVDEVVELVNVKGVSEMPPVRRGGGQRWNRRKR